ncbi:hypothetical protein [Sulfuricurvum sp.]|uniref:hypothetical protein n=1 Tax=Sulfuricurvum sp. TaxID=2025608 RepID=UPI002628D502|nr:hypothetical protein [Sulfuricurvum sp.]MDD4949951.1 hypothetical protein [Sulfuricurvum sp.]
MKKIFLAVFVIALVSFMSMGCMTTRLWQDPITHKPYSEKIDAFLLNPQNGQTVFLGEKYHYIFDANAQLDFLLKHREDISLTFNLKNGAFYQTNEDNATAHFSVSIDTKNINQELLEWLKINHISVNSNTSLSMITINLKGKRYLADPKVNQHAQKFSKSIEIQINDVKKENRSVVIKILATPLAVAADGVMFVAGMTILIPLAIAESIH